MELSGLDQMGDDFDRVERACFGGVDDDAVSGCAAAAYPFVVDEIREERVRLPYTFAAVLGMTDDRELRIDMARNEGYFDVDTPEAVIEEALERVDRARTWAERMDNAYNYRLQEALPTVAVGDDVAAALAAPADFGPAGPRRDGP